MGQKWTSHGVKHALKGRVHLVDDSCYSHYTNGPSGVLNIFPTVISTYNVLICQNTHHSKVEMFFNQLWPIPVENTGQVFYIIFCATPKNSKLVAILDYRE